MNDNFSGEEAINKIWEALVTLDYFLQNKFIDFLNVLSDWEPKEWHFILDPYELIKNEKFNIPRDTYEFCENEIFQRTLFDTLNSVIEKARDVINLRDKGDDLNAKLIMADIDVQVKGMIRTYSDKVYEFKENYYKAQLANSAEINSKSDSPHLSNSQLTEFQELIGKGEIDIVFRKLLKIYSKDSKVRNDLIVLASNLSRVEMDFRMGLIERESRNVEYSKIIKSLLEQMNVIK